jgi:hypothetical protein
LGWSDLDPLSEYFDNDIISVITNGNYAEKGHISTVYLGRSDMTPVKPLTMT